MYVCRSIRNNHQESSPWFPEPGQTTPLLQFQATAPHRRHRFTTIPLPSSVVLTRSSETPMLQEDVTEIIPECTFPSRAGPCQRSQHQGNLFPSLRSIELESYSLLWFYFIHASFLFDGRQPRRRWRRRPGPGKSFKRLRALRSIESVGFSLFLPQSCFLACCCFTARLWHPLSSSASTPPAATAPPMDRRLSAPRKEFLRSVRLLNRFWKENFCGNR